MEAANAHLCLQTAYLSSKNIQKARKHFNEFVNSVKHSDLPNKNELIATASTKFKEGLSERDVFDANRSSWECHRSELPEVPKKADDKLHFPASSSGDILQLKDTGTERGWITEAATNISIGKERGHLRVILQSDDTMVYFALFSFKGDILLVEKPYANPLTFNRTQYCYACLKRCHNLIPCKGCPNVSHFHYNKNILTFNESKVKS